MVDDCYPSFTCRGTPPKPEVTSCLSKCDVETLGEQSILKAFENAAVGLKFPLGERFPLRTLALPLPLLLMLTRVGLPDLIVDGAAVVTLHAPQISNLPVCVIAAV